MAKKPKPKTNADTPANQNDGVVDDSWKGLDLLQPQYTSGGVEVPPISYDEIVTYSKSANPTVRSKMLELLDEIDLLDMAMEDISNSLFQRPSFWRSVVEDDGTVAEVEQWVGIFDDLDSMADAKEKLDEKGVDAPSGGGGGGGSYYISEITSDQWQRIRRGEIDKDEAEWENDEENYDEDGELREYGVYADEDEEEDS